LLELEIVALEEAPKLIAPGTIATMEAEDAIVAGMLSKFGAPISNTILAYEISLT
jgi:hypothetical protein